MESLAFKADFKEYNWPCPREGETTCFGSDDVTICKYDEWIHYQDCESQKSMCHVSQPFDNLKVSQCRL